MPIFPVILWMDECMAVHMFRYDASRNLEVFDGSEWVGIEDGVLDMVDEMDIRARLDANK
jgi:hypothetical protein